MSNAITIPPTFGGPVSAVFQGAGAGDDLSGGITGGYALLKYRGKVWSIQHNGNVQNLMREDGDGPRGSVDVVILKANAQLSKTFYINGWDENNNNPPDCASANGIVPDQGVPHPQSTACATCPRNAWGSAPNGGKGKACGDHRRMAIVPLADLRNETFGGPMLLRCPAASLQDMAAFDSRYKGAGYPYFTMGIKIGFDPAESYPKFTFAAIRPLTDAEAAVVMELRNSPETARVVHEHTGPAPAQVAAPPQVAFIEPQQVQVQPAPQPAPAPVATPAVAQPAPVVAQPAPAVAPAPVGTGVGAASPAPAVSGFGPLAAAPAAAPQPQPAPARVPAAAQPNGDANRPAVPQQPVQTAAGPVSAPAAAGPAGSAAGRPAVAMTGFGPVTPEVTQPAAQTAPAAPQAAPAPAAPVTPGMVSDFEGSIDDRLSKLLA